MRYLQPGCWNADEPAYGLATLPKSHLIWTWSGNRQANSGGSYLVDQSHSGLRLPTIKSKYIDIGLIMNYFCVCLFTTRDEVIFKTFSRHLSTLCLTDTGEICCTTSPQQLSESDCLDKSSLESSHPSFHMSSSWSCAPLSSSETES